MNQPLDAAQPVRQQVLGLIRKDPGYETLSEELAKLAVEEGEVVYAHALEILTDLQMGSDEARMAWERMVAHGRSLNEALGRPVALATAALDYFTSEEPAVKCPRWSELESYERIAHSAVTDPLTGLCNNQYFRDHAQVELEKARRYGTPFSIGLFDLDHFKSVNDTYGHLVGDAVLIEFARCLRQALREVDLAARYGGEEFAMLLPNTKQAGAFAVAERLRRRTEEMEVRTDDDQTVRVTVSGGVASYDDAIVTVEDLIAKADKTTYAAKENGRNRIQMDVSEQREFVRVPTSVQVRYRPVEADERQANPASSENISKGGIYLVAREPVLPKTVVRVEIELPGGYGTVEAIAQVVHNQKSDDGGFAIGVRFLSVESEDRTRINRFVWDQLRELRALDATVRREGPGDET